MSGTTPRGVPYMGGGDAASTIDTQDQAKATWINDNVAVFLVYATYAGLPAAAAANDRFITYVTDARAYYRSDGAAWSAVPTIEVMTTTQRDALVAGGKWTGRVIFNTTTANHEKWDGAVWGSLGTAPDSDQAVLAGQVFS